MNRRWAARTGLVLALVVAGTGTAPAATGHSAAQIFSTPAQQERAGQGALVVGRWAETHPASGYSTMTLDEPAEAITVYWLGPVPGELRDRLVATGLTITFHAAAYDAPTLAEAARAGITPAAATALAAVGVRRGAFGPSPDGNGLELGYVPLDPSRPVDVDAVRRTFQTVTGVRVVGLHLDTSDARFQPDVRAVLSPVR